MKGKIIILLILLVGIIFFQQCKKDPAIGSISNIENKQTKSVSDSNSLTPKSILIPYGFPTKIYISPNNSLTVEGIELGKKLYYDTILSNTGKSCSSCHLQAESFALSQVNSLAHINLAWSTHFLWNGKISGSVEDAMMFEVEYFFKTDLNKLNQSGKYNADFLKIFKVNTITSKEVAYALAQFIRTLISANSKYDKWLRGQAELSESEMRGYNLFNNEAGDCFHCHGTILLTDSRFHNNGLDAFPNDKGLGAVTNDPNDDAKFKTPTLRNIALTPPYMHDGRFKTLEQVVNFYSEGVQFSATIDPLMKKASQGGVHLTAEQKQDLITFLKTFTDVTFTTNQSFILQ